MTLIEVIDAARSILNEPLSACRTFPDNSSGFWGDGTLQTYHNLVQNEIAQEIVQTFEDYFLTDTTLNISAGVARYTLPTNFNKMRKVEHVNGERPITVFPIGLNDLNINSDFVSGTFYGDGYRLEGNSIVLENTPTTTINSGVRLVYEKSIPDITASTDSSQLPNFTHRGLVWGIVKYALNQMQADNNFAIDEYEKCITKYKAQLEDRQVQTPRRVKIRKSTMGGRL